MSSDNTIQATQDPLTQSSSGGATPPAADGGDKKSPLDILEDILKESDNEDALKKAQEEKEAAEKAAKIAEYEAALAEQKRKDEEQITQQLKKLEGVSQTPENQARLEQIKAEREQKQQDLESSAGFEIAQLDHEKVPADQLE